MWSPDTKKNEIACLKRCRLFTQSGLASVEFAVGVLIFLVLMLVAAEFSRAFFSFNTLTKSVRSGSRYLASNAYDDAAIDLSVNQGRATNLVLSGNLNGGAAILNGFDVSDLTISQVMTGGEPHVSIAANYAYTPIFNNFPNLGFGTDTINLSFNMQAVSVMRIIK